MLPELLIERHDILIEKIGTRLKTHATETDIARLFIALVEYRFMRQCPIKTFRNACTTSLINKKSFMKEVFRKHTKISFRHLETAKSR
ncbi:DUF6043 family protein [Bacteroides fragilis]|uniref:DUF6043 family protein n=1 Tax=Bacteroides fragilis TaxID=817 RepID=UPI0004B91969|nr:DUF6043 family protein [Bacteroides fragilis]